MNAPGRFITVEGGEGAGKSTNLERMVAFLEARGLVVEFTREPGGTPLAEEIREGLLAPRSEALAPLAELLLVFAARAQHLSERIEPALTAGRWVVCDRFTDASFAYQGGGRELGPDAVAQLARLVHPQRRPDLTVYLDLPPDQGLARARHRGEPDRIERESVRFFERVRAVYLDRAAAEPERFAVVDASRPLEAVGRDVLEVLGRFCERVAGDAVAP